jgi:hypothetical protein
VIDEAAARPQGRTAEAPTVHAAVGARDRTQTSVALLAFRGRVRFRESTTRFLRSPALALVLLLVALVFPTTNVARFDGVPLSAPHEILLLLLGATALLSPGLRRRYGRLLEHGRGAVRWIMLIAAVIAIVAKAALLANGASEGFVGCYSSPVAQEARCERSFANPLSLHGATRVDREIDFGPRRQSTTDAVAYPLRDLAIGGLPQSNWDVGFVNSNRFNFYEPGAVDRGGLPLSVRWTGTVAGTQSPLRVQYVGEVAIEFAGATNRLPASYSSVKRARIAIPPGRHPFVVEYRFDRVSRIGKPATGPYARLRILSGENPLTAVSPGFVARTEAAVADVALVLLGLSLTWLWVGIVVSLWPYAIVTAGALALAAGTTTDVGQGAVLTTVVWALVVAVAWRRPPHGLSFGFIALAGVAIVQSAHAFPSLDAVLYRGGGSDWLTYESFARDIFSTHSPQGGEDVFYYQPGYRYLLAAVRLLLGEGDLIPSALAQALTNFAILVLAWRLVDRTRLRSPRGALIALGTALTLAVLNSATVVSLFRVGASEWPTWAAIPAAVALLFCGQGRRDALGGTVLLAIALLMRPNQAPALALLLLLSVGPLLFTRRRTALACISIFTALALLPAVHNVVYGQTLVFTPTGANVPQNLLLRPSELDQVFDDRATRELLVDQAARTFYFKPAEEFVAALPYSGSLARLLHGLQLLWVAGIAFAIVNRRRLSLEAKGLLLAPALLLLPFLFYNPLVYYPRHMVAGHLAMAVSAMFVFSGHARERRHGVPRLSLGWHLPRRRRRRSGAHRRDARAGTAG